MAVQTYSRLYDNHDDAVQVVSALEAAGFRSDDVSMVANNADNRYPDQVVRGNEAGPGAGVGAVVAGGAGLLAGIGVIAIPGIGPVVAAGWLAATLAGAVAGGAIGGLVGSLIKEGVPEEDAHLYAESIRRGSTLVTVRADNTRAAEAERILSQRTAVDTLGRRVDYRSAGWTGFREDAAPYVPQRTTEANRPL